MTIANWYICKIVSLCAGYKGPFIVLLDTFYLLFFDPPQKSR